MLCCSVMRIRCLLSCCLFAVLLITSAAAQKVTKIADVDVGPPFKSLYSAWSSNGQYVACVIDNIGVLRIRTYPTEHRDTVPIPDSVTNVWAIGVTRYATLLTFASRTTGLVHLAALAHNDTVWRVLEGVMPPKDSTLGTLRQWVGSKAVTASSLPTVAIVGTYAPKQPDADVLYRTVFLDAQTYAVKRTVDSVAVTGVNANGTEFYRIWPATDGVLRQCTYFDGVTGAALRTVPCPVDTYRPTGVDHVMFNTTQLGALGQRPVSIIHNTSNIEECVLSPNVYAVNNDDTRTLELLDVVTRTRTVVDDAGDAFVDNLDSTVTVWHANPFRLRVFRISGMQRHEGLVCTRYLDTTEIYTRVAYGAIYVGAQHMAEVTAVIDGQPYPLMGRTEGLVHMPNRVGTVSFSAMAKAVGSGTVYRDSMVPLVVRYPGRVRASLMATHSVKELSLSKDDGVLGAGDDPSGTFSMIALKGTDTPVMDTIMTVPYTGGTLHATMSPLVSDDAYVVEKLRDDDPNVSAYRRSVDQLLMRRDGTDSTLIRSVWLAPDVAVAKVITSYSAPDNIIGMHLASSPMSSNRLYLTRSVNSTYQPVGDTSGIGNRVYGQFDLSVPGNVVVTDDFGRVTMQGYVDTAKVVDATVESLPAIVINDSTILTNDRFYTLRGGTWQPAKRIVRSGVCRMFLRLSSAYTLALRGDADEIGYIIDNAAMSVVDSLGKGFYAATCALYSSRFRGLFIGYASGIIGFVPLPSQYLLPTSVLEREKAYMSEPITSCAVYTLQGSKVAEGTCTGELSAMDVQHLSIARGCYIIVYRTETGGAISKKVSVWK